MEPLFWVVMVGADVRFTAHGLRPVHARPPPAHRCCCCWTSRGCGPCSLRARRPRPPHSISRRICSTSNLYAHTTAAAAAAAAADVTVSADVVAVAVAVAVAVVVAVAVTAVAATVVAVAVFVVAAVVVIVVTEVARYLSRRSRRHRGVRYDVGHTTTTVTYVFSALDGLHKGDSP